VSEGSDDPHPGRNARPRTTVANARCIEETIVSGETPAIWHTEALGYDAAR